MGEISSISKKDGKLVGHAKDPITSGLALESFFPDNYWEKTGAEVFIMGAGGSSIAVSWYLMKKEHGENRPSKIIIANRSTPRLNEMRNIHAQIDAGINIKYVLTASLGNSDKILNSLK